MEHVFVLLSGIFAGWVNVLAGGGSFLTLPLLTYSGLGLDVANGTNRLAIFLQNVVAVYRFWREGKLELKKALQIAIPITIGAVIGSMGATLLPKEALKRIVGVLLIFVFIFMFRKRKEILRRRNVKRSWISKTLSYIGTGLYGGFIQAGVGFFLIYVLTTFEGLDIVEANAYKVFTVLFYSVPVIVVFSMGGKFSALEGLILSLGTMIGAYFGTKSATKKGAKWVEGVVFTAMILSAALFILGI